MTINFGMLNRPTDHQNLYLLNRVKMFRKNHPNQVHNPARCLGRSSFGSEFLKPLIFEKNQSH